MVRKTNKYYIDQLKSNPSDEIIEEVLKKYGHYNRIQLEHQKLGGYRIKSIVYVPTFGIYLTIESSDNNILASLPFDAIRRSNEENASLFFQVNYDTYLQVTPDVYTGIIKELIKYLSPESSKNRKAKGLINKSLTHIYRMFDARYYHDDTRTQIVVYISDYIKEHADELLKLKSREFEKVIADTALDKFKQIIIDEYIAKNE